jgi:hypothetical protein
LARQTFQYCQAFNKKFTGKFDLLYKTPSGLCPGGFFVRSLIEKRQASFERSRKMPFSPEKNAKNIFGNALLWQGFFILY